MSEKTVGIHQVTLPLPFRLDHVHCYLAQGNNGWTIIDSGLHTEETEQAWKRVFREYKIDPRRDVERIVLTHFHPDHFGFAGTLQEWTGAAVHMSKQGKAQALSTWTEQRYKENRRFYRVNGLPEHLNQEMAKNDQMFFSLTRPFPQDIQVIEQTAVPIGDHLYEAISTPGHAEGHLCFYQPERKILFGGDLLLKKITPNVSYLGKGDDNPLASFLVSMEEVKKREIEVTLPGHGPIFHDTHDRIEQLIDHHQQRLRELFNLIDQELDAYQICQKLFRRELSIHEIRFALGETIAHLRYLQEASQLTKRVDANGTILYMR
ncbi:hypothetical protein BEP19_10200 [Ammoniphilus oxalaticus]|uniref:Metallo-beta-lactamase domain-containing protein n=1 Tax=Ammoniphilus oxalaticus TaxID=66863 RepID=A0A419SFR0_9BACL|nr:MBL fold metallo-hydrolase [Ammoniphilus oxalaticus]RKD22623.1 hypothetical protein BEP19_10200 [Ammoniphilus oxalaticus]